MKSCFLFGHSDTPQDIQAAIEAAVEQQYRNHGIRLYLLLPYHPAERPMETPEGFDGTFYPPLEKIPRRYAIVRANRYMIETCDSVICYVHHIGNARTLWEYARRRAKKCDLSIENPAETNWFRPVPKKAAAAPTQITRAGYGGAPLPEPRITPYNLQPDTTVPGCITVSDRYRMSRR